MDFFGVVVRVVPSDLGTAMSYEPVLVGVADPYKNGRTVMYDGFHSPRPARYIHVMVRDDLAVKVLTDECIEPFGKDYKHDEFDTPEMMSDEVLFDAIEVAQAFAWPEVYGAMQRTKEKREAYATGRHEAEQSQAENGF